MFAHQLPFYSALHRADSGASLPVVRLQVAAAANQINDINNLFPSWCGCLQTLTVLCLEDFNLYQSPCQPPHQKVPLARTRRAPRASPCPAWRWLLHLDGRGLGTMSQNWGDSPLFCIVKRTENRSGDWPPVCKRQPKEALTDCPQLQQPKEVPDAPAPSQAPVASSPAGREQLHP